MAVSKCSTLRAGFPFGAVAGRNPRIPINRSTTRNNNASVLAIPRVFGSSRADNTGGRQLAKPEFHGDRVCGGRNEAGAPVGNCRIRVGAEVAVARFARKRTVTSM